ncbi:PREDICTED: auxin-binding protein ABP19a-like [Fragaria vesca subsp. vesca]|uniref:auxin-binding protein ABP19a-like n=1 Tax=Fragaria vesca subsp. vesca TaxID=101020 RepID=UPI0002C3575F|nr:PREDICTED: auxin-binding protein ABP19a-like [Fragaria vesca subsp. vesca]
MMISIFFMFSLILSSSYAAVQDFCVADYKAPTSPAGYACKNPSDVKVDDFVYSGLGVPGNISNLSKVGISAALVAQVPGLNGLGLSMVRADLEVGGVVPLHTHRASEAIFVAEGKVIAGFIASDNKAYVKNLKKGDFMVLPRSLLHFQVNAGSTPALVYALFSSDDPGVQILQNALFQNDFQTELIAKTTLLDTAEIKKLKALLGGTN